VIKSTYLKIKVGVSPKFYILQ